MLRRSEPNTLWNNKSSRDQRQKAGMTCLQFHQALCCASHELACAEIIKFKIAQIDKLSISLNAFGHSRSTGPNLRQKAPLVLLEFCKAMSLFAPSLSGTTLAYCDVARPVSSSFFQTIFQVDKVVLKASSEREHSCSVGTPTDAA